MKFKTNIKCGACVAAVTPEMEKLNLKSWAVDLTHPDRILTVEGDAAKENVKEALHKAGYAGEEIS
jgi:copper chaperone